MDPIIDRQTTSNGWKRALEREEGENMCTTHSPFPPHSISIHERFCSTSQTEGGERASGLGETCVL